jgi:hypothetical protein
MMLKSGIKVLLGVVLFLIFSGCVSIPNMSKEECSDKGYVWDSKKNICETVEPEVVRATSRVYKGVTSSP